MPLTLVRPLTDQARRTSADENTQVHTPSGPPSHPSGPGQFGPASTTAIASAQQASYPLITSEAGLPLVPYVGGLGCLPHFISNREVVLKLIIRQGFRAKASIYDQDTLLFTLKSEGFFGKKVLMRDANDQVIYEYRRKTFPRTRYFYSLPDQAHQPFMTLKRKTFSMTKAFVSVKNFDGSTRELLLTTRFETRMEDTRTGQLVCKCEFSGASLRYKTYYLRIGPGMDGSLCAVAVTSYLHQIKDRENEMQAYRYGYGYGPHYNVTPGMRRMHVQRH